MLTNAPNLNYLWAELVVEELVRQGVEYFCLAPGSRSAALISAASRNRKAKTFVHFDERALAFHAVGYISGSGRPAALIVTSGTAGANALPAIIEASKKKLPLIVLTADRPPELQKTGAMQTIEQEGLYRAYVRFEFDVPCPSEEVPAAFVLTTVDQAVSRAKGELPGPVHLNCHFREPLSPEKKSFQKKSYLAPLVTWLGSSRPYTTYILPEKGLSHAAVEAAVHRIGRITNGIIAVGKLRNLSDAEAVLTLAERTGFPVFPDITSGLRLGSTHPNVISYFDQLLLSTKFASGLKADGIIHIGGRMTSKRYYDFCRTIKGGEYISVLPHPLRNDPLHRVTLRIQSDAGTFARSVSVLLPVREESLALFRARAGNGAVGRLIKRELSKAALNEMAVARVVSQEIPRDSGLFLSNSMPVRDMDMYADPLGLQVLVGANRGASGIDGIMASAVGFAVGLDRPVTLVIGDLAFLHDLNSLAMLSRVKAPVTVVVVNNDGGGIFSFLPIAQDRAVFEECVATPHGLSFGKAAELFNLPFLKPTNRAAFIRAYRSAVKTGKPSIIECAGSRQTNLKAHQMIQDKIRIVLSLPAVNVS